MAWIRNITRRSVVRGVLCAIAVAAASIVVRAQSATYTFSTIAGGGPGNSDGVGQAARFNQPAGIAIDSAGTLYVNDRSNRSVRKVGAGAVVTTLASGFLYPSDIAVGPDGSIYVADLVGNAIKKISAAGAVTVFASSPAGGFGGPTAIAIDGGGTVFLSDAIGIFTITPAGVSSFLAGRGGGSTDGVGAQAQFQNATGLAPDGQGNVYVADSGNHTIRKIAPGGVVTTVAGLAQTPGSADGTGESARFNNPSRVTVSASGTIYVTDTGNHTIRAVSPVGVVTTLAGSPGSAGSSDGPVSAARFNFPTGVVADAAGNLYVADTGNHTVRKISVAGIVTTLAGVAPSGSPSPSFSLPSFSLPRGITIDADQRLAIADTDHHTVQHLTSRGVVTAIAGTTSISGSSDDYSGESLSVDAIAIDSAGSLYVASYQVILKITPSGSVTTLAGKIDERGSADGTGSTARFYEPSALVVDGASNVYVADSGNHTVRKITPAGVVTTLAGLAGPVGYADGTGYAARFAGLSGITVDPAGNVYVVDIFYQGSDADIRIRKITPAGVVTTLPMSGVPLSSSSGLALSPSGTFYIADRKNGTINAMTPNGVVTILAGTAGALGDVDGAGEKARFDSPVGLTVDAAGMIYVADLWTIRKVTPTGVVTTVTDSTGAVVRFPWLIGVAVNANGTLYVGKDDCNCISRLGFPTIVSVTTGGLVTTVWGPTADGLVRFSSPRQIASGGRLLYVADTGNHTIRVGTPRFAGRPAFTTFAGVAGASGTSDGIGSAARFNSPSGVAVDGTGNIFVADTGNHTVRKITAGGVVTTLAGLAGSSGSADGSGSSARFSSPSAIAADSSGTLYVADTGNHAIRKITAGGVVTTVAGVPGSSGSADGVAADARFRSPAGIAVDGSATVYVADTGNHTLRAITQAGVVSTIGGLPATSGIADGVGDGARFNAPVGITVDAAGALYIADTGNSLVRIGVLGSPVAPTITLQPVNQTAREGQTVQFTVSGTGNPSPGYQWQWQSKSDAQSWFDLDDQYGLGSGLAGPPGWAQTEGAQRATLTVTGSVAANGTNLRAVLTNAGGSTTSNVVTLTVHSISLSPTRLTFGSRQSNGVISSVTPAQRVTVVYTGPETLQWMATTSAPWLRISRGSGTGAGTFDVAVVDPGNLVGYDTLRATIRVSDSALELSALVDVNLNFGLGGALPFGTFDTPFQGATGVSGSIAVTGWALDDIAVERVEIWRDLVSGETTPPVNAPSHPGHGKVFIANALFVDGARPDVVNRYGGSYGYGGVMPLVSRSGWGYLLLTWGLWSQGNGPYTLYAFAFDQEGNSTTLGTKTISVDNANATRPFGALDVPTYGETRSGSFQNFGWALTPGANAVDSRSCTITNGNVFMGIDSGPLTPVSYGDNRTDVAGFFPGFSNGSSAGGHYLLDTATLSNGVHQIGWYVVDSCGRVDGIGSRFFTVLNESSVTAADAQTHVGRVLLDPADRRVGAGPLRVRRTIGEWADIPPNGAGVHVVAIDQSERVEVRLPALDDATYTGAQVVNGERRALPLGSSLDAEAGIFYWQPAAGFLGSFDLEFTPRAGSTGPGLRPAASADVRVRVVVGPPMRMAIDTPAAGVIAQRPITVAGWAIDLAATDGSGIDTVHVWAYPAAGGEPIFLGVAGIGDARPDVAAIYGPQFEHSSYSLAAPPLAPGTYDIVIYPHRAATGTFDGAQVVRVTVP